MHANGVHKCEDPDLDKRAAMDRVGANLVVMHGNAAVLSNVITDRRSDLVQSRMCVKHVQQPEG